MKSLAFVLFLTVQFAHATNKCPSNPGKWCDSLETAESCKVTQQCLENVWISDQKIQATDPDSVNFTLYYETLCPDFMSGQLWDAFNSIQSIMNLVIVPYGNAQETWRNETKLWQFTCQHGGDECYGNLLHSCFIYFNPKPENHLPFIHCMESSGHDIRTAALECSREQNVPLDTTNKCMQSRLGNTLQHQNALLTQQLNPPHTYVPWVTLNGVHTEAIQDQAQENLIKLICDTYKGENRPEACDKKMD